ncbi:MAG: hypothetical protein ABIE94_05095 [archaeon]
MESDWGAKEGTQMFILDGMFKEGGHTLQEMAKACNSSIKRVRSSMYSRSQKYNFSFVNNCGRYYIRENKLKEKREPIKIMKGFDL